MRSIAEASNAANRTAGEFGADRILCEIALAQATAGDDHGALATAGRITGEAGNDGRLADICEVQCWENHLGEAIATATEIVSARVRSAALVNLARIRARDGDLAGAAQPIALALEAAGAIADSWEGVLALEEIAETQLDAISVFRHQRRAEARTGDGPGILGRTVDIVIAATRASALSACRPSRAAWRHGDQA